MQSQEQHRSQKRRLKPPHSYVSETDFPLVSYAKKLCDRLEQAGFSVDLTEYSNNMLLSRVISGKYDVFLASDNFMDITTLEQMDYIIMDSEEMR